MYNMRQRTKSGAGQPPRFIWESGKLAGSRFYFYLQSWNEKGFLVEEAPKGWIVSRASKITSQSQFIRDLAAVDYVSVYQAETEPSLIRVSSVMMGENLVSLPLYEDFMSKLIREEGA